LAQAILAQGTFRTSFASRTLGNGEFALTFPPRMPKAGCVDANRRLVARLIDKMRHLDKNGRGLIEQGVLVNVLSRVLIEQGVLANVLSHVCPSEAASRVVNVFGTAEEGFVDYHAFLYWMWDIERPEDLDFSPFKPLGSDCCRIEQVEHRGITLRQLQHLQDFFDKFATADGVQKGWWDRSPYAKAYDIRRDELNLYQLVDWVVNPATKPYKCSWVELVAKQPQPATWFVSHWWGEPVVCFIACVEEHARLRGLSDAHAYWVCAYANNQHELGKDLGTDPSNSSFMRAMENAEGVLLILDPDATPFTRIWCCFEESVTVMGLGSRQNRLLFDIGTTEVDGSSRPPARLLTDGTAQSDEVEARKHFSPEESNPLWHKCQRESKFPISVIRKGLAIDVEAAQASKPTDRTQILNYISGRPAEDLNEPPYPEHPKYREVSTALAGIFAATALRAAIQAETDVSDHGDLPLWKALREDTGRRELVLLLGGLPWRPELSATLGQSLPAGLASLTLDLSNNYMGGEGAKGLGEGLARLSSLASLTLDLRFNDVGGEGAKVLGEGLVGLSSLTSLTLDLRANDVGGEGAKGLEEMRQRLAANSCHVDIRR